MSELQLDNEIEITRKREESRQRRLANLKPVVKGQVLNPRGRPKKDLDLAAMAQEHAMAAIRTLVSVMHDEKATPAARVTAASELLDRGFGRAPQTIEAKVSLSDEFEAFVRSLNARTAPMVASVVEGEILDAAE